MLSFDGFIRRHQAIAAEVGGFGRSAKVGLGDSTVARCWRTGCRSAEESGRVAAAIGDRKKGKAWPASYPLKAGLIIISICCPDGLGLG